MTPLYAPVAPYRIEELRSVAVRIRRRDKLPTPLYFNGHSFQMSGEDWGLVGTYQWAGWESLEDLLQQLKDDFEEWCACNPPIRRQRRRYVNSDPSN